MSNENQSENISASAEPEKKQEAPAKKAKDFYSKWGSEENPAVTIDRWPLAKPNEKDKRPPLPMLKMPFSEVEKSLHLYRDVSSAEIDGSPWGVTLSQGYHLTALRSDMYINALQRGDWRQYVEHDGIKIAASVESYDFGHGKKLTANAARNKFLKLTNTGGEANTVFYNSGFLLTVKTPNTSELDLLIQRLQQRKANIGYESLGAVFSNRDIYKREDIFNFCKDNITYCNVKGFDPDHLDDLLLVSDYFELVKTMADAIHINGYKISQPCVVNPDKCRHVSEDVMNIRRMTVVDNSRISSVMAKILASDEVTTEQLLEYKRLVAEATATEASIYATEESTVPEIKIIFKMPTMREYIASGKAWLAGVEEAVRLATGNSTTIERRTESVTRQLALTLLREYSAFIKRIVFTDDDTWIDTSEEINEFLDNLTTNDFVRDQIVEKVTKYQEDASLSVVCLPAFKCPACQGINLGDNPKHPHLIPIDAVEVFFQLAALKL